MQYLSFHFGNCNNVSNSRTSSFLQLSSYEILKKKKKEILKIRLACFWYMESQILTEMKALGKKINVDQGLREDDKGEKVTT